MTHYDSTARVPFKRGGSVKKSSSEFSSYNKIRDHIDREQKLKRRKEEMEMDRRKINQEKKGVMVAKGGSVKDKVMKGVKTFNKTLLGPQLYQKFYGGALPNKKYKGKVHSTRKGRSAATKRTIKRGAKKALNVASYVHPLTAGFKLGKKFRDKKRKVEHN